MVWKQTMFWRSRMFLEDEAVEYFSWDNWDLYGANVLPKKLAVDYKINTFLDILFRVYNFHASDFHWPWFIWNLHPMTAFHMFKGHTEK